MVSIDKEYPLHNVKFGSLLVYLNKNADILVNEISTKSQRKIYHYISHTIQLYAEEKSLHLKVCSDSKGSAELVLGELESILLKNYPDAA